MQKDRTGSSNTTLFRCSCSLCVTGVMAFASGYNLQQIHQRIQHVVYENLKNMQPSCSQCMQPCLGCQCMHRASLSTSYDVSYWLMGGHRGLLINWSDIKGTFPSTLFLDLE